MSFFDVGGLLIHSDAPRSPRLTHSPQSPAPRPSSSSNSSSHPPWNFSYPSPMPSPRTTGIPPNFQTASTVAGPSNAGSNALLQDIGGLLRSDEPQRQSQDGRGGYFDSPPMEHGNDHSISARGRRDMTLADALLEEDEEEPEQRRPNGHIPVSTSPAVTPPTRYAPLQQGRRAQRELQDVGGLLS